MFKKLKPNDYETLKPFFSVQRHKLSQYCLSSLIFWDNCINGEYFLIDDGVLFISERSLENPDKKRLFLPLLKDGNLFPPARLAGFAKKLGHSCYDWTPGDYISEFGPEETEKYFRIYAKSGYSDYIYYRESLVSLKGSRYSGKRNLVRQFRKNFPSFETAPLETVNPKDAEDFFELWNRGRDGREELLECEKKAITQCLDNFARLEVRGIAIFVGGRLSGFAAGSEINREIYAINFEKGLGEMKGLYQFLDNAMCGLVPERYEFINKESDLGKPGLRKSKLSYYPVEIEDSYMLELK